MSLAEIKALFEENGDRDETPADFNRRLLAVLQRDHAKAVKLVAELNAEIEHTPEQDDPKLARKTQTIFAKLLVREAEISRLIEWLTQKVELPAPSLKPRNAASWAPERMKA